MAYGLRISAEITCMLYLGGIMPLWFLASAILLRMVMWTLMMGPRLPLNQIVMGTMKSMLWTLTGATRSNLHIMIYGMVFPHGLQMEKRLPLIQIVMATVKSMLWTLTGATRLNLQIMIHIIIFPHGLQMVKR